MVEQSQKYSGPLSPSSGKAPHLPWFRGHCPSRSLSFQRSYPPVWVLGWAGQAWISGGSKDEVASHQAVAGTWLECVMNPPNLRPLPGTVQAQQHRYLVSALNSEVHPNTFTAPHTRFQVSGSNKISVARQCPPCFQIFLPANRTPSFIHRGHPRCPQNWRGTAPSKREGRCSRCRGS